MPDWRKNVQNILDEHVKRGVVGVSLAISMPETEITHFTSGLSDKFKKLPMRPEHLFRIASCTKTFIATGLHLLVEDGKVDLDEPISTMVSRTFPRPARCPCGFSSIIAAACPISRPQCR